MSAEQLRNLATNNIINFDANAFVKGTKPEFVGDPDGEQYLPLDRPIMAEFPHGYGITAGPQLHGEPSKDAFISHGEDHKKIDIPWATILTIGSLSALAIAAGMKIKSFLNNRKTAPLKTGGVVSTLKAKASSLPKPKDLYQNAKTWFTKLPPWGKVTGGIAAGLAVLYGIYKLTSGNENQAIQEGQIAQGGQEVPTPHH